MWATTSTARTRQSTPSRRRSPSVWASRPRSTCRRGRWATSWPCVSTPGGARGAAAPEAGGAPGAVLCGLSKRLGGPVGSMLAGPADLIEGARGERQRLGGGMRQAGVIAAAGLVALRTMVERLADDHPRARRLADAVGDPWPEAGCGPKFVRPHNVTLQHEPPEELIQHLPNQGVRARTNAP